MSTPCPDCGAPLVAADSCTSCGLRLRGPLAQRLWWVDQQLAALTAERLSLLARLRSGAVEAPAAAPVAWSAPAPRRETTPHSAQTTLLGLGALLLAAAVLVFAAVTYSHLGAGGRALVLVTLTALAGAGATVLARRSLPDSAEAVGAVALVLAVADAWAVRRAGLASDVGPAAYAAAASGVLAVLAGAWAAVTPLRVTQGATVVLAQGLVVLELQAHHGPAARVSLVLALLAAVDLVAWRLPLPTVSRWTAAGFGGLWAGLAVVASAQSFVDREPSGCAGLLVLAGVAAYLAWERVVLAAAAVPVLAAAAAFVASNPSLTDAQRPLVLSAAALLSLQACALLKDRTEAVLGALAVAAGAVLVEALGVVEAVGGPFTWLSDQAWTFRGRSARDAVAVGAHWDGTIVTVVVVAAAAAAALAAGLLLDRTEDAALPAGLLLGIAGVALPLGLATDYRTAIVVQLVLGVALCGIGARWTGFVPGGLAVLGVATSWSLAQQDTTLVAVAVSAVVVGLLSLRLGSLTGAALLLAGGEVAAVGAAQDLHVEQVGATLLVVMAAAAGLSAVVRDVRRWSAETAATALGLAAVVLAATDPGWLSWALAAWGLAALGVAVQPDRRLVGYAGALLLSASSWVRLADAHVHAPEPYVLPLAVMTLVIGYVRRRTTPGLGSLEAYGAGLSLAFLPSVVASLDDTSSFRALLVLLAACAVVLVGAQRRLRAPLLVGSAAAAVEAVHLVAPYAAALPRWLVLAAAGAALVGVGATYEQRLRDVYRLRERYDSLA